MPSLSDLGMEMEAPPPSGLAALQPQFPLRHGIDTFGRGITNPIAALLQIIDGHGLSGKQLDRNRAMYSPLYGSALREHPEILAKKIEGRIAGTTEKPPSYGVADRRSLAEDLNSVQIKYNNWKKQNYWNEELTPQDRVTQGFVDVRNPNSWF